MTDGDSQSESEEEPDAGDSEAEMQAGVRVVVQERPLGYFGAPTSLGLFATRDIAEGEFVDFYSVFVEDVRVYKANPTLSRSHVCVLPGSGGQQCLDGMPMASALTRYIASDVNAMARMLLLPASAFGPSVMYAHMAVTHPAVAAMLARFHELPKGCLINSPGIGQQQMQNCRREHDTKHFKGFDAGCAGIPYIVATKRIECGQELQ